MRILTILAALSLVAVASPVAADGVDVSARYLEEESSCTESHTHSGGGEWQNNSYSYWSNEHHSEACSDEFTYASASAAKDDETVAAVSADGHEWSRGNASRSDSASGWSYDDYSRESEGTRVTGTGADGWSRDVTVETMAGDAQASRGCSSTYAFNGERSSHHSSSSWDNRSVRHASWDRASAYTRSSECHESVSAGDATVARRDECTSSEEGRSYDSRSEYAGYERGYGYEEYRGEFACFNGATVDAAGEHARAGIGSDCAYEHMEHYRESQTGRESWTYHRSDCRNGVIANGPMGANAFVGFHDWQWQSCDEEGNASRCESGGHREGGADAQWERSPAGPLSLWFYRSLP